MIWQRHITPLPLKMAVVHALSILRYMRKGIGHNIIPSLLVPDFTVKILGHQSPAHEPLVTVIHTM